MFDNDQIYLGEYKDTKNWLKTPYFLKAAPGQGKPVRFRILGKYYKYDGSFFLGFVAEEIETEKRFLIDISLIDDFIKISNQDGWIDSNP